MTGMEIAKAVARDAIKTLAEKDSTIKAQRRVIVILAIALMFSITWSLICASKM